MEKVSLYPRYICCHPILYTLIAFDYIQGLPIVPAQDLTGKNFVALEVLAIIFFLLGILYIVFNYIRIFVKIGDMLWRKPTFLAFLHFLYRSHGGILLR